MRFNSLIAVSSIAFALLSQSAIANAANETVSPASISSPALQTPVQPCPTKSCAPNGPGADPTSNPVTPAVCENLGRKGVSQKILDEALRDPTKISGWGQLANPNVPASPYNTYRRWLTILDTGKPFSPYNGLVFKSGCR